MPYDINEVLERLERNLSDVDSARNEVMETVNSSNRLQATYASYAATLDSMHITISNLIEELREFESNKTLELNTAISSIKLSCDEITDLFKDQVNESISHFRSENTDNLQLFTTENAKLADQVNGLSLFSDSINETVSKVNEIDNKLDKLSEDVKLSVDALQTTIENQFNVSKNDIIQKCDSILSSLSELHNVESKIETDLVELNRILEISNKKNTEAININKWILIVGIMILFVLHFL